MHKCIANLQQSIPRSELTLASASINMPPLGSNLQSEIQKILVPPRHQKLTICFSGIALSRT